MRITNRMITSQFNKSLNKMSVELNRLNVQVVSGRKFSRASENTSAAVKAFQIRKDMVRAESYKANVEHAKSALTDAESAVYHIENLMKDASDKIIYGLNGSQSIEERRIIATELRNIQEQLLQTLNSTAADSYYFGGSNTTERPFSLDGDGKLVYNGVSLGLDLSNPANADTYAALSKDSLFVDIGLNVEFIGNDIDESTVFAYSVAGINIVGKGTTTIDGEEIPNNLYDLLGAIAGEFESPSYGYDKANALFGHLKKSSDGISSTMTEIGTKTSYLEFMSNRIDDKMFNLTERQQSVEGIDPAEAIIHFESQRFAYNAALQMGSQILQPTIFDYMK